MRQPLPARVEVVRDVMFGVCIDDPYRWMESESPEFAGWLDEQAAYAADVLAGLPERDVLLRRLRELRTRVRVRYSGVTGAGGRIFFLRADTDGAVPVLAVSDPAAAGVGAPERVVLDPNTMAGTAHAHLDWYVPSPDGRFVACGVSHGGSEHSTLFVVDVDTGTLLPDTITGVWFPFVSWCDDYRSFVYHRMPHPAPDMLRLNSRSLLHRLGTDPAIDRVVLAPGVNPCVPVEARDRPFLYRPPGSGWMVAIVSHGPIRGDSTTENLGDCSLHVAPSGGLDLPEQCDWRAVATRADGVTAFALGSDTIYLVSHRDAPRRRVLAVPLAGGPATVAVPESERVIEAVRISGDHLLIRDLDGGITRLRRIPLTGGVPQEVTLPVDGTLRAWTTVPDRSGLLLSIESWTIPPRWFRYDAESGTVVAAAAPVPGPADSTAPDADVEAHRITATARDGTPVPISVIHRSGIDLDGTNPLWLVGYGSHGVALTPSHEAHRQAWLERGGIWAVAHLRGGGEFGRAWHEAGRLLTKENTITDFIDCAEHLIACGYTRPDRLVGAGGSAGGIPTGGALVRRPDLWAGMVITVPVLNSLRYEFSPNGPLNIPETGSVTTEDGLRALLIADAYHRIADGVAYPPVLVTAGRNDSRVPVWQPAKFVARLLAAAPDRPILLRVDPDAGHGQGSTTEQRDRELADAFAFALAATSEQGIA